MTIERTRPLPPGRYWVDVFEPQRPNWEAWRNSFVPDGHAVVTHTESFPATDGAAAHDFVIFEVNQPTVWPDADMGIGVNRAPASIQSSDDTVSKPDVPSGLDTVQDALSSSVASIKALAWAALGIGGAIALLSVLVKVKGRR